MRIHFLRSAILLVLLPPAATFAQETQVTAKTGTGNHTSVSSAAASMANWTGPKMRLGVMDLNSSALKSQTSFQPSMTTSTVSIPAPADFARGMTEMLTTALVKTNRFVVLERAVMEKVVGEQDFGAGGRVNVETAPKAGKIIGAQAIITGDITEFSYTRSSYGGKLSLFHGLGAKLDKANAQVGLDIRVVDATTGQVIVSQRSEGKASMSDVSADVLRGDQGFSAAAAENTPLGRATRQALEEAVNAIAAGMKRVRWSGRVIDVRGGVLYVNAGSEMGIPPGLELDVYRPQEALVDPESGQSLGAPDSKIASIVVDAVQEKYCVAKVPVGNDLKRGDVVRLKGEVQQP